jgi:WD40 repeat protein
MLPDGRILYLAFGDADSSGLYVAQPNGSEARRLGVRFAAAFAPTGHLLFLRGNTLLAQVFDLKRLQLAGEPFLVAENVASGSFRNVGVSASADGLILYRLISGEGRRQLVWFDRSGKELQRIGTPDDALAMNPSLSPDGRRVALHRGPLGTNVWVLELGRDVFTRLTLAPETDVYPIWSPDGKSIVFASNRKGIFNLYEKPSGASGNDNVLLETEQNKTPTDWSPDGKFILFQTLDLETNDDIWALPMSGERKPFPVVQTRYAERDAQFSADGHWIAYQSNESGRFEIYVQSFPDGLVKTQITNQGGAQVRWRRDGKELFYIAPDGRLIAIPIRLPSRNGQVGVGAGTPLFVAPVGDAIQGTDGPNYAVSPDGTRFLINTLVEEQAAPLTLIVNWKGRTVSR